MSTPKTGRLLNPTGSALTLAAEHHHPAVGTVRGPGGIRRDETLDCLLRQSQPDLSARGC
jgi:hypothetical protein